jgi:large subunit ribosomal protein L29
MSDEDLLTDLEDTHQALFNLRFQTVTRQLADVSQVSRARRRIARIKTLLTERDILAEVDGMLAAEAQAADGLMEATDEAAEATEDAASGTDDDGDDEDGGS